MQQTKLESLLEASAKIATGFVVSWLMWAWVVAPLYASKIIHSAFIITSIFTVSSFTRSHIWRRFFNAGFHRGVHFYLSTRFYSR